MKFIAYHILLGFKKKMFFVLNRKNKQQEKKEEEEKRETKGYVVAGERGGT